MPWNRWMANTRHMLARPACPWTRRWWHRPSFRLPGRQACFLAISTPCSLSLLSLSLPLRPSVCPEISRILSFHRSDGTAFHCAEVWQNGEAGLEAGLHCESTPGFIRLLTQRIGTKSEVLLILNKLPIATSLFRSSAIGKEPTSAFDQRPSYPMIRKALYLRGRMVGSRARRGTLLKESRPIS